MLVYLIASSAAFWLFFIVWKHDDVVNFITKMLLLSLALSGTLLSLIAAGFIIKGT